MNLLVALEHHFIRCSGGVFTDLAFGYDYWREYLEVFDEIIVAARVKRLDSAPNGMMQADGEKVKFFDMPDYYGIKSFLIKFPIIFWRAFKATCQADRYLLRSGNIGTFIWLGLLLRFRNRYARECMGHVKEGITAERPKTIFYKLITEVSEWICKYQVKKAVCASYTSEFLRKCYPCQTPQAEFVFSGVRLTDNVITSPRSEVFFRMVPFKLLSIGRVELQKGHLWLVNAAIELAKRKELPLWTLDIVGPGTQIPVLKQIVQEHQLVDRIRIIGSVKWGEELFSYIDHSALFILPSLTEGMPRSLIEAMARGIPAIGSNTGGIPELLSEEDLVEVENIRALADKIAQCMVAPDRLTQMSLRNFQRAKDFKVGLTKAKKLAFWRYIRHNA